jgi:hypothetical protein
MHNAQVIAGPRSQPKISLYCDLGEVTASNIEPGQLKTIHDLGTSWRSLQYVRLSSKPLWLI